MCELPSTQLVLNQCPYPFLVEHAESRKGEKRR